MVLGPPRYGNRIPVTSKYPEAFLLKNMEFDTEYCFRYKHQYIDWSGWLCARTPAAPPRPGAPGRPELTLLPATTGKGELGPGHPFRILVEWEDKSDPSLAEGYSVEWQESGRWRSSQEDEGSRESNFERAVAFPKDADPDDVYTFRVCAYNLSGRACSPIARTPGRGWTERSKRHTLPGATQEPVKAQGRVKVAQPSCPPISICDAARAARERNSPAAPGLEAQCKALGGGKAADGAAFGGSSADEFAAKGEALANADPLSAALRTQQPQGAARRGFDIGLAAAEGQTAWGPGKQKMLDSLDPGEQEGFKVGACFSMDRNRNAELARAGAAIAETDPEVAQARSGEADARFWLGSDIGSGIFGDPALGASATPRKAQVRWRFAMR